MSWISKHARLVSLFVVIALLSIGAISSLTSAAPGPHPPQVAGSDIQKKEILLASGTLAAGANTPVNGSWKCISSDMDQFGFQLVGPVGTMTGTGPTLAVHVDNSIDNGTSVAQTINFVTINATVTPQTQFVSVGDVIVSSTYAANMTTGDCWRVGYTAGGTTPGGTLSVKMIAKDNQPED